mmetsp:Transcript_18433/g.23981  ORF Transcript_18433/g.23981 Transcript_18433/m.23981 type:complete len:227 (+) Transcript_18433:40-720(+)
MSNLALNIIKLGATCAAAFLNATPFLSTIAILQKNAGPQPVSLPFAMIALNGTVWTVYGVVIRNWFPLVASNLVGIFAGVSALLAARAFHYLTLLLIATFVLIGILQDAILDPLLVNDNLRSILGMVCVSVTICMFASPLVAVREVIRTKSTTTMSFTMTVASFVCALLWLIFGICINDIFVWLPNTAGLLLSVAQLILFWHFHKVKTSLASCDFVYDKFRMNIIR